MHIVFDSSTLILLAKSELLDLFLNDFPGRVLIPKTVEKECLFKSSADARLIQSRIEEGGITVKSVRDRKLCSKIERDFNINLGESEAIIMAGQFKAIVATDDWNAIQACKVLRIPFTSALGILCRMLEKHLINRESAISKLASMAEYGRYSEKIIQTVRRRLEE